MPLNFDFPLDKLKTYTGINPCPSDFDAFWDTSIEEMKALGTACELVKADFESSYASCFHLYFQGVGGSTIHAQLIKPKRQSAPGPGIIQFHGYSALAEDWAHKLAFAAEGYTVAFLDCRGQGGLSEDRGGIVGTTLFGHIIRGIDDKPENLLYRNIFLDTAQLTRIVMAMDSVDENRIGATGGSQGGGLTLACAALEPSIKMIAPFYPFLSDYKRVWEMDLAKNAYNELSLYFRRHDPLHERENEIFTKLGYIDIQHLCPRIKAQVMLGMGLMDQICPPSTQFAAYNKISAKKSLVIYPDYEHERLPWWDDKVFNFFRGLSQ